MQHFFYCVKLFCSTGNRFIRFPTLLQNPTFPLQQPGFSSRKTPALQREANYIKSLETLASAFVKKLLPILPYRFLTACFPKIVLMRLSVVMIFFRTSDPFPSQN